MSERKPRVDASSHQLASATDTELFAGIARGDLGPLGELFDRHHASVRAFAERLLANLQHAPRLKPTPTAPENEASGASRDFAEAMQALARGDFGAGAGQLASLASAYPRDPRAEDAVYLEAIALERAGRISDAKAIARRYLSLYPEGAHHLQAGRIAGD